MAGERLNSGLTRGNERFQLAFFPFKTQLILMKHCHMKKSSTNGVTKKVKISFITSFDDTIFSRVSSVSTASKVLKKVEKNQ